MYIYTNRMFRDAEVEKTVFGEEVFSFQLVGVLSVLTLCTPCILLRVTFLLTNNYCILFKLITFNYNSEVFRRSFAPSSGWFWLFFVTYQIDTRTYSLQDQHHHNCGLIPTHYNYKCILVLTALKMATWLVETCRWLICNKITFMHWSAFVGYLNILYICLMHGTCNIFIHLKMKLRMSENVIKLQVPWRWNFMLLHQFICGLTLFSTSYITANSGWKFCFVFGKSCSDSLRAGRSGVRIPVNARFSAPVQTVPVAHLTFCTVGTGSFSGVKRPERGVDHPPHLAPRLKKE
jgi:hypothetical protein